jgi:hypothetical protein
MTLCTIVLIFLIAAHFSFVLTHLSGTALCSLPYRRSTGNAQHGGAPPVSSLLTTRSTSPPFCRSIDSQPPIQHSTAACGLHRDFLPLPGMAACSPSGWAPTPVGNSGAHPPHAISPAHDRWCATSPSELLRASPRWVPPPAEAAHRPCDVLLHRHKCSIATDSCSSNRSIRVVNICLCMFLHLWLSHLFLDMWSMRIKILFSRFHNL